MQPALEARDTTVNKSIPHCAYRAVTSMVQYIPAVDHSQAVLGWLAIQKKPLDLNTTGSLPCSSTCIHSLCGWKALFALYTKVAIPNSSDSGARASPRSSCFQPAAKDALSISNLQRMADTCHTLTCKPCSVKQTLHEGLIGCLDVSQNWPKVCMAHADSREQAIQILAQMIP